MVAAGSVVSCDCVLAGAAACGVAFRVAMASQFASQAVTPFGPSAAITGGTLGVPFTTSSKWWSRDMR
jgi:hypothetical protein